MKRNELKTVDTTDMKDYCVTKRITQPSISSGGTPFFQGIVQWGSIVFGKREAVAEGQIGEKE